MSAQRLKITDDGAPNAWPNPPSKTDPITAWLDTLSMVLRLPRHEREGVRDDLACHLRERVRDLMLSGTSEPDAARVAIGELGDAVKLANRLRAASRSPARRMAMNITVLGVAGAALVASVVALRHGGQPPAGTPSVMMALAPVALPDEVGKVRLTFGADTAWEAVFKQIQDKAKMPVIVRWKSLEEMGCTLMQPVGVAVKDTSVSEVFRFIAEESGQPKNDMDFRVSDGRITVATTAYFDQQETVLVAYDLSQQAADRVQASENITFTAAAAEVTTDARELIEHMVHTDDWTDMGGTRASTAVFGAKLFIKAPKRFHTEVQWVIDQLPKGVPVVSQRDRDAIDLFETTEHTNYRTPNPPRGLPVDPTASPTPAPAGASPSGVAFPGGATPAPSPSADPVAAPVTLPGKPGACVNLESGVPVLRDVPLISSQFVNRTPIPLDTGPITVLASQGSGVEVSSASGTLTGDRVSITPEPNPAPTPAPK